MSGLVKTPTITPKFIQSVNGKYEKRHVSKHQDIAYDADADTYDSGSDTYTYTHDLNGNVEIVSCGTANMSKTDSSIYVLRIVIPEASADNAGHIIHLKDINGHAGLHNNKTNKIQLVYKDDEDVYHDVHAINDANGHMVVYSYGTGWRKFSSSDSD